MNQTKYECFSLGHRCATSGLLNRMGLQHDNSDNSNNHIFDWNISRLSNILLDHTNDEVNAGNKDYAYYKKCSELARSSLSNGPFKMGVYISHSEEEIEDILNVDRFLRHYGKTVMKNVYFILIHDKHRLSSKLELCHTTPNGSQIFKIYLQAHPDETVEPYTSGEEFNIMKKVIERSLKIVPKPNTTFVSCLANIYKTTVRYSLEQRVTQFGLLADSGVLAYVYACDDSRPILEELITQNGYTNIKVMNLIASYMNLPLYKICEQNSRQFSLPSQRNIKKDTVEYISLMVAKMDFMNIAVEHNPFQTENFAWIDFSIMQVLASELDVRYLQKYLQQISHISHSLDSVVIPGCWSKIEHTNSIIDYIHWRFCGGFFAGNKKAIRYFYQLHIDHLLPFIKNNQRVVWEVNFWAYLEHEHNWKPVWFPSDHNRRILEIPSKYFAHRIHDSAVSKNYVLDPIDGFIPSSCAFIEYNNQYILNTRYVNYTLTPTSHYIIYHPEKHIHTKNMCSVLNRQSLETIEESSIMKTDVTGLVCRGGSIYGFEDIRLFISEGHTLKFIATNVNYSPTGTNSMFIGNYDYETHNMFDVQNIKSPDGSVVCEKNWIPLPYNEETGTQYYIYSWHPLKIGKIVEQQLVIVHTHDNDHPLLNRARGSTIFQETEQGLIGVVHFSDEGSPRNYYHMLVVLDPVTYKPVRHSNCFYFNEFSVEFCTGFFMKDDRYHFFISNFDRNPQLVSIDSNKINIWVTIE